MEEEIKMAEQGDGAGEEGESSADIAINSSPIKRRRGRPQGSKKLKVQSELVQAAGTTMEEEIKMAETEQGDDAGEEGESSADIAINSSPIKRRSGRPQGSKKLKVQSELVQAAGTTMEEEIKMAEQGDGAGEEGESSADMAINSSPIKRRSGMPQGSKKLKVCVTDIKLMELVSGISNGGSTQPQKGRGSPKLSITTHTEEEGSGDDQAPDSVPAHRAKGSPKGTQPQRGRGRPKLSITTHTEEEEEEEGSGDDQAPDSVPAHRAKGSPKGTPPQRGRGRPKLSITTHTEEEEEEGSGDDQAPDSVPAHRAKGSPKGTPPQRGRGRPKLSITTHTEEEEEEEEEGSGDDQAPDSVPAHRAKGSPKGTPPQRGRGRPKLSITTYTEEEEEGSGDDQAPDSVPAHRAKGVLRHAAPERKRASKTLHHDIHRGGGGGGGIRRRPGS
ncbi:sarcoplasmic reticulum histidine-rich calcium-binding protein-like isoform X1 [Hippoglossus stenolepis]|uniref:sarcoplasmic reticulum histidine-rich calcium-binding protein-like isoform X1 n=1 Tax=Hippoglossus stenolepis TaxID=195615 RepID=UPI001FAECAB0|nr:sarcoplasmic reticulum histidine-rich calcium-binding protein-like isoform X1 [Hippoglossus stenolepis]